MLHLFYWRLHIPFFLTHEFHKNVISSRQVDEKSLIFGEIIFKSYRDTHSDLCDCHGLCALSAPVSANKPLSCIMYIYSDQFLLGDPGNLQSNQELAITLFITGVSVTWEKIDSMLFSIYDHFILYMDNIHLTIQLEYVIIRMLVNILSPSCQIVEIVIDQ